MRVSRSIVVAVCGALAVAGCAEPASTPARPMASAPLASPTAVDPPVLDAGPTASVLPSPTATPAGPTLVLFEPIRSHRKGAGAADVTRPDRLDDFLDRFDLESSDAGLEYPPRLHVEPWIAVGARVLAFVLAGCANDGATLDVRSYRVRATLTGGEHVQCDAPQYYLAVFAVPAGLVPAGAVIE